MARSAAARRLNPAATYRVCNLRGADKLSMHTQPSSQAPVIGALAYATKALKITGAARRANRVTWVPVQTAEGTGWVNQNYLCAERAPANQD